jgi:O-antigen ligase
VNRVGLTAAGGLSGLRSEERRAAVAEAARSAARLSLAGAIVLSPFRARILLDARPLAPVSGDYTNFLLFWSELLVLGVLLFWGVSLLLQPRKVDFGPLRLPLVGLLTALCLSVLTAVDPELSLFNVLIVLGFAGLALYVLNEVESVSQLLPAIAIMIVIQALMAIGQLVNQESLGLQSLGEYDLDPANSGISVVWPEGHDRLLRAYGLSDHPNILGGVLACSILLVATCLGLSRGAYAPALVALFVLAVAGLFATFSRGAAIALAAGVGVSMALLLIRRDWPNLRLWLIASLAAALLLVPLIAAYAPYLSARVNPTAQAAGSTEERALSERDALLHKTNAIFIEHPLTGVGVGGLPTAMFEVEPNFEYHHSPAHIVILVVAAETGVFGAVFYGLLMVVPWLLLWFHRRRLEPDLIGVSGALLAITVVGFFDYYTWSLNGGRFWFWLALGLWLLAYRRCLGRRDEA